jgi:hypothetical protein
MVMPVLTTNLVDLAWTAGCPPTPRAFAPDELRWNAGLRATGGRWPARPPGRARGQARRRQVIV